MAKSNKALCDELRAEWKKKIFEFVESLGEYDSFFDTYLSLRNYQTSFKLHFCCQKYLQNIFQESALHRFHPFLTN